MQRDRIQQARALIVGFTLTDPTLWPILSEIDAVLLPLDTTPRTPATVADSH